MEARLFDPENPPAWLDPEWWRDRPNVAHLEHPASVHRARLKATAAELNLLFDKHWTLERIIELGAGDGTLVELLDQYEISNLYKGYEIIDDSVNEAWRHKRNVAHVNFLDVDWTQQLKSSAVVVMTEVLEHMTDPHAFLRRLSTAPNARFLVASSPVLETAERHEWNHAWCWDYLGYEALLLANGWMPVSHEIVEWSQIVVALPNRDL